MFTKILSQDVVTVASMEEVKAQCRLMPSFALDDPRLVILLATATELAQTYTNKLLSLGSVAAVCDNYRNQVLLWGGNVTEITSVTCYDVFGTELTIEDDGYRFDEITQSIYIDSTYNNCANFKITYLCGYTDVPTSVKQGVLLLVATMYNSTEDYLVGLTHESLPYTSVALFNSVKDYYAS